jgi:hypothetical protein
MVPEPPIKPMVAQEPVPPQVQPKDPAPEVPPGRLINKEKRIEYRDEKGNLLNEEQVRSLKEKSIEFQVRPRCLDAKANRRPDQVRNADAHRRRGGPAALRGALRGPAGAAAPGRGRAEPGDAAEGARLVRGRRRRRQGRRPGDGPGQGAQRRGGGAQGAAGERGERGDRDGGVKDKLMRSFLSTVLALFGGVGIWMGLRLRWVASPLVILLQDLRALSGHARAKWCCIRQFNSCQVA